MSEADNRYCPLCLSKDCHPFHTDAQREYLHCALCRLVHVPDRYWLTPDAERATYDLHENNAQDEGYRQFLSRLSLPLLDRLGPEQFGLDFGCGPDSALTDLLSAHGHRVDQYDPFYFDEPEVFSKHYDFICATEVVEHLRHPGKAFRELFEMLKKGGWLGIMTKLVKDVDAFRRWHYIRDLTHICFFSRSTFQFIATQYNATLHFVAQDVILLQK